ncbi:Altered inheritance of mitochondria protein 6 [Elasticomyces elasticus]|nr:Altered inheritance of mitochondria protein 6 [Elasticomyces elasticus]KAK3651996.1 Altered inheritance of mitochondria protein 6 [Elasticomyces elasticus]KAK4919051.1 Altered inheritance of mitochondria protein 6 [Elasticomyces elasticus]KAK5765717.1 Altered inheritance of mitochondria protein 6 [Elasticomyces elasticus]
MAYLSSAAYRLGSRIESSPFTDNSDDHENSSTVPKYSGPHASRIFALLGLEQEVVQYEALGTGFTPHPKREIRRYRRSRIMGLIKRSVLALPVLMLIFFGVIHLLEFFIGRARLFWNEDHSMLTWLAPSHSIASAHRLRTATPLPCVSHNDYWRDEPLFDALRWGCTGVEADVWLFEGELYVGHTTADLDRTRTFKTLYIDPLLELLNKSGTAVYSEGPYTHGLYDSDPAQTLVLLVDVKRAAQDAFEVVHQQLQPLRDAGYLSSWDGQAFHSRAVTVVGTGETLWTSVVSSNTYRDVFFDAPLSAIWEEPRNPIDANDPVHDKDGDTSYGQAMSLVGDHETPIEASSGAELLDTADIYNISTSYYASTDFASAVGFVWRGHLSPRQMRTIRGQIRGAKRRGLKARYWGTPLWPTSLRNHVWHVLVKEGADVLNVNDLEAAARQDWSLGVHDLAPRLSGS